MTKRNLEYYTLPKKGLVDGPFGSNLPASDYTEFGIPVIRGVNLSKGKYKFKSENFKFVSEQTAKRLSRCTCISNDIIFTKKGTIGQVGIIPENSFSKYIISSNQMRMRLNTDLAHPLYVYYYLSSPRIIKQIIMEAMTTGVPKINLTYIKKFKVNFPLLQTQKKIANILSAYDDLIENNNQRIQLLEDMAEEIYKEWFVRLRFPGYENCRFFDKNGVEVGREVDGALPEDWEKVKAKEIFDINIGKTPPRKETKWFTKSTKDIKWVSIKDINSSNVFVLNTSECITQEGVNKFNMNIAPKNTIILSFKLTVGRVAITTENMLTNEAIAHFNIKSNSVNMSYTYWYLRLFKYGNLGNTSSIGTAINSKIVKNMPFIIPTKNLVDKFDELISSFMEEIEILVSKNQVLQETRDLLLPRLISGKLDVSAMEVAI